MGGHCGLKLKLEFHIAELLNQGTMRESNAAEKLDSDICWLACHANQAHHIPGKRLVRLTINRRVGNFFGGAFALFRLCNYPTYLEFARQ